MHTRVIPSYSDLFQDQDSYEELLGSLSSESVITICIALINELESGEERYALQERIFRELQVTFTECQKQQTDQALEDFWQDPKKNFDILFHRVYLLEMLLRELNHFRKPEEISVIPQEYNFYKAYIRVCTDVNQLEGKLAKFEPKTTDPVNRKLELLWKPTVRKYEFNERPHLVFEQFKLMCFMKYARIAYRDALISYLESNHLATVGNLLKSLTEVSKSALTSDPKARLKKLVYIKPQPNVDEQHLKSQTVNIQGLKKITIRELKKFPLYLTKERGYMVIDPSLYMRKNYFGPFFELYHKTQLRIQLDFNAYSSQISQVLEADCFRPLLRVAAQGLAGVLKVDDGTPNTPDGYFRIENLIFLFEYKASIFPEELSQKADIEEIKNFINKKFIASDDGKKGITQLAHQVNTIYNGGYEDDILVMPGGSEQIRVYPIIVHHDFLFSLPGVNDYLDSKFHQDLKVHDKFEIMPLTLMNLSVLMDLILANCNLALLDHFFIDYFNYLQNLRQQLLREVKADVFLDAHMSFDEYFQQFIVKHLSSPDHVRKHVSDELIRLAGISFDDFNAPL
jgi:hypothetical protein